MKTFKDTSYGDLTGETYHGTIELIDQGLESLVGSPETVMGIFDCSENKLTTLKGSPENVMMYFTCSMNPHLKSLEGGPKKTPTFFCDNNPQLKDPIYEICANQIKANRYITDKGSFNFSEIADQFESHNINNKVKSKGFRTLLGLKNE